MEENKIDERVEKQAAFLKNYLEKNFQGIVDAGNAAELYKGMMEGNVGVEKSTTDEAFLTQKDKFILTSRNDEIISDVTDKVKKLIDNNTNHGDLIDYGELLNKGQKSAIAKGMKTNFLVITGGPGTGKTYTVKFLIKNLLEPRKGLEPKDIVMCAPTGKAQARMKESLLSGVSAVDKEIFDEIAKNSSTIHSLLGKYNLRTRYNAEKPLPFKVIIVDECSMIDISLFNDLLAAVRSDSQLILLGDQYQLPPIGLGAIFTEFCNSDYLKDKKCIAFLDKVERVGEDSNIHLLATAINKGEEGLDRILDFANDKNAKDDEVIYIVADDRDEKTQAENNNWRKFFEEAITTNINDFVGEDINSKNFKKLTKHTILTATNKGKDGVESICNEIHTKVVTQKENRERPFAENQLVLVTENQKDLNVFNGDIGIVRSEDLTQYVYFDKTDEDGNLQRIKPQTIVGHKLGYALSIHKSQGSEYENVLVIMDKKTENLKRLLTRQLFYTAVTRAKSLVVIQTTKEILREVLENFDERITPLNF